MNALARQPCAANPPALDQGRITHYLSLLASQWEQSAGSNTISRRFEFSNYDETIAFVKLVASVSNHQDHHPELSVSYHHCRIEYSTHSAGELTDNDFICAAKIDKMQHI